MSDLRQQMREYGLGAELEDADYDDIREAICQAASDRERMVRAERALRIERAISDFWEAEALRRGSDMLEEGGCDLWFRYWCGCTERGPDEADHSFTFCFKCNRPGDRVSTIPSIVWWHAHRRVTR